MKKRLNDSNDKLKVNLTVFADKIDGWLLALAILGNLLSGAAYPVFLYLFGQLANSMTGSSSSSHWTTYILFMAITAVADFAAAGLGAGAVELAAERQLRQLRLQFLSELMRQEIAYFDAFDATILSTQLAFNIKTIREALGQRFGLLFLYVGFSIAGLIFSFVQSTSMTLISMIPVPLILLSGIWASRLETKASVVIKNSFEEAGSMAQECLQTLRTVKAYNLESMMRRKYNTAAEKARKAGTDAGFWAGLALGTHWGLMFLSFGLGFWWGVRKVANNIEAKPLVCFPANFTEEEDLSNRDSCFTAGQVISVFWCVVGASFFLSKATPSISNLKKAKDALRELLDLYNRTSAVDPYAEEGLKSSLDHGDIRLEHISFAYQSRPDIPVFQNLSAHMAGGKCTAIVGASGCGKSTIIDLIERFHEVHRGCIKIDGIPLGDYNVQYLRSKIALVNQQPRLFANTIAMNIACGKKQATFEEVVQAAKEANAHDFIIRFPNAYDTWVGEGGAQLSGGQKQRLAIARALIRQPVILILDEATSALDNESEKMVQKTLDSIVKEGERTCIIVAHKLTTIQNADKIIVLDNHNGLGAVVAEEGNHKELITKSDGLYAALVKSQVANSSAAADEHTARLVKALSVSLASEYSSELPSRQASLVRLHSKFSKIAQSSSHSTGVTSLSSEVKAADMVHSHLQLRTLRILQSMWWNPVTGSLGAIFAGLVWPAFGICFAYFIEIFAYWSPQRMRAQSLKWALGFVVLGMSAFVSLWLQRCMLDRAAHHILYNLRVQVFEALLKQNLSWHDSPRHSVGQLLTLLATKILRLRVWGGEGLAIMTQSVITICVATILALMASWKLGLVCLACVSLMTPVSYFNSRLMHTGQLDWRAIEGHRQSRDNGLSRPIQNSSPDTILIEAILNIKSITAFNLQSMMSGRYQESVLREYAVGKKRALYTGLIWGASQSMTLLTFTLCMWYGFRLVDTKEADGRRIIQSILCLLLAALNIGRTFSSLGDSASARESAAEIYQIIDSEAVIDELSVTGGIRMDNVQSINFVKTIFSYPTRRDIRVYNGVTFEIPRGKVTALVGASGCGKSTAVQLIERYYDLDPQRLGIYGSIRINGKDIADYNVQSLRQRIGIVSQEPLLFWGSIAENISYGHEGATPAELEAAAREANAWDFIQALPQKMETDVGQGGSRLSGGQRQRIAIARAIVRRPDLLILDEATSALDTENERITQQALSKILETRQYTTLVIAHRMSTIRDASHIVVLANPDGDGSVVVEQGTHEELCKIQNGVYHGFVRIAENI